MEVKKISGQAPQALPQATPKKETTQESLFGDIKTKKVTDPRAFKALKGEKTETLKQYGYYVVDKNNNGIYDEGDELHKQITVMLDAGHGSGKHLQQGQKFSIPGQKEPYVTVKNDTLESIAKKHNVDLAKLQKANAAAKASRDPGAIPPKSIGTHDEAYLTGLARSELREILEQKGFKVIDNVRTDRANLKDRQRVKLNAKPNMFISLHCDSSDKSNASGETVLYNPAASKDKKFAEAVNKELQSDTTIKNRAMQKRENLCVLKGDQNDDIAEILVEMGFLSNKADYDNLNNKESRKKQLDAIAKGVENYSKKEIK
ncbi:MAG: N-acetylmuramoyl-L-alanine amidase [bacterium]|nr:N-acetylmuramoyl-L-alanine amidase [bacterium]